MNHKRDLLRGLWVAARFHPRFRVQGAGRSQQARTVSHPRSEKGTNPKPYVLVIGVGMLSLGPNPCRSLDRNP